MNARKIYLTVALAVLLFSSFFLITGSSLLNQNLSTSSFVPLGTFNYLGGNNCLAHEYLFRQ